MILQISKERLVKVIDKFRELDYTVGTDDGGQEEGDALCRMLDEILVDNRYRKHLVSENDLNFGEKSNNPTPKELGLIG